MSRRGKADGSRLLGWDKFHAAHPRVPHDPRLQSTKRERDAWLRWHPTARLVTPDAQHPYWSVFLGPRYLTAATTRTRALSLAIRLTRD